MSRIFYLAPVTALLLTACVVAPESQGPGFVVAPALPLVVELGAEPYYFQNGYYYYYHDQRWGYSNAKTGPWRDLPRDHYPREVRYRDHYDHGDHGDHRDSDHGDKYHGPDYR